MLIEIENWKTKEVIFSYDCEDNTVKKTVEKAVKIGMSLHRADLHRADLSNANLNEADLSDADLKSANLQHANLQHANLNEADLYDASLNCASLNCADLKYAYLERADLSNANLNRARICRTILSEANLSEANLSEANLVDAHLVDADLNHANLSGADLGHANFIGANLSGVDLSGADLDLARLTDVDLSGAKIDYPMNIPDGEFIAWKKIHRKRQNDYVIVKLKILAESKRSRATTNKCRCDKALVLGFETLEGEPLDIKKVTNYNRTTCTYKVGKIVYADEWDDNRWNECSHGIHFFLDRQRAVEYPLIKIFKSISYVKILDNFRFSL